MKSENKKCGKETGMYSIKKKNKFNCLLCLSALPNEKRKRKKNPTGCIRFWSTEREANEMDQPICYFRPVEHICTN